MSLPTPATDPKTPTTVQWKALAAAFLGWMFDGLDGYLYVMVAGAFVGRLLGKPASDPETISKSTIIQSVFLVGWAVGGVVFGRVGDRLGRARTLTYTVLTYAIFTGLSFFATQWWHLLIFRFVAALGIGGEWAAGSALVSETLPRRHKVWGSAFLQSGYMSGCILASLTSGLLRAYDPKWVFVVGVVPALLTVFIRAAVPEPESWRQASRGGPLPSVWSLLAPGQRRTTVLVTLFVSLSMVLAWAVLFFVPKIVDHDLPEAAGWTPAQKAEFNTRLAVVFFSANIVGNFAATYLAQRLGYRKSFFIMLAAALVVFLYGFSRPLNTTNLFWITPVAFFFGLGFYGNFPLYIPPLFPTLIRTLGAGFAYNVGRLVSAVGVFFVGQIVQTQGAAKAVWLTSFLFIPAMLLALALPEPKEEAPDAATPAA